MLLQVFGIWHTHFKIWHKSVTHEDKNHTSIDILQIEVTCTYKQPKYITQQLQIACIE